MDLVDPGPDSDPDPQHWFVHTICEAAAGVCESGMVPMAGGRQGSFGESAKKSSDYDIWAKSKNL